MAGIYPDLKSGAETGFQNVQIEEQMDHEENKDLDRPPLRKINIGCPCYINKRYIQAVLIMAGFIISFGIRCNVGVAMVKMHSRGPQNCTQSQNATHSQFQCHSSPQTIQNSPQFHWSPQTIGYVDVSFFWGYIITQIPGGFLASRLPANRIFGTAIFISSCLNLLIPSVTNLSPIAVIIVRFIQGLVEGVTYPSCFGIWIHWAPPMERSILATLALAGSYGGAILGLPISGYMADYIGWYAPYYAYGFTGIIWYLFWLWLSFEKPATHPAISAKEQTYIEQSIGDSKAAAPTMRTTPWLKLLSSMPVWAIVIANFAQSWTCYLLLIIQPTYFKEIFKMNIAQNSFLAILPHFIMMLIVPLGGLLADCLRQKTILSTTNVRKIFNCCGFGGEVLFLLVLGFTHNPMIAVIALLLAVGSSGFTISGFNVNHLDIAPRYASILMGVSNTVGSLAAIVCPIIIQFLTEDHSTRDIVHQGWKKVFLITCGINAVSIILYGWFASGEIQEWAKAPRTVTEYKMNAPGDKPDKGYEYSTISNVDTSQYKKPTEPPPYCGTTTGNNANTYNAN